MRTEDMVDDGVDAKLSGVLRNDALIFFLGSLELRHSEDGAPRSGCATGDFAHLSG